MYCITGELACSMGDIYTGRGTLYVREVEERWTKRIELRKAALSNVAARQSA